MAWRIVVTGPESTGKSTLALALGRWLNAPVVPEYARTYAEMAGRALTSDDVEPIARGQMASEDAVLNTRPEPLLAVLDTDLMSTCVYADHYYGLLPPWIAHEAARRRGDLYLLTAIDLPWHADGVRDQPFARAQMHSAFASRLSHHGCLVLPVRGLGAHRLEHAMAAVRGWRVTHVAQGAAPSGDGVLAGSARVTR